MSQKILNYVKENSQTNNQTARTILLTLAKFSNEDGIVGNGDRCSTLSVSEIAKLSDCHRNSVLYWLPKLEEIGELEIERFGNGRSSWNKYKILPSIIGTKNDSEQADLPEVEELEVLVHSLVQRLVQKLMQILVQKPEEIDENLENLELLVQKPELLVQRLVQKNLSGQQYYEYNKELYNKELYKKDLEHKDLYEKSNGSKNIDKLILTCPPPKFAKNAVMVQNDEVDESEKPKRKKTERDILLLRLENFFCETTGHEPPLKSTKKQQTAAAHSWWNPLWLEIYDRLAGRDIDLAERLILDTVKQMRDNNLTIKAPKSIVGIAADIKARGVQEHESDDYWVRASAAGGGVF